jgi:beta-mannosidase
VLPCPSRARVGGHEIIELTDGWEAAACAPGEHLDAAALTSLNWRPAPATPTAAAVLTGEGAVPWEIPSEQLDGQDWWFRTSFETPEGGGEGASETVLALEGVATVAEVYLNGTLIHERSSMFERSCVDVGGALASSANELAICCRALTPLLEIPRKPRARWRTRVVADGALRFFRTMLLGRAPGFAPGPAVVGPWRPVRLEHRGAFALEELELRPRVAGTDGVLSVRALVRAVGEFAVDRASIELDGGTSGGSASAELEVLGSEIRGELVVGDVALWWPHTHGHPSLYAVRIVVEGSGQTRTIDAGSVGFRSLGGGERLEADGLALSVNGEPIFVRGALWTPPEALGMGGSAYRAAIESQLRALRDGGMNMVRLAGVGLYESGAFHDLCDELGILVWQDFMFANLDYPESDSAFLAVVAAEARQLLGEVGGRPSLVVLCGSSEIAQQIAMMGLDPSLAAGPLFGELLPGLIEESGVDAIYVPSAPWGGDLPFRPDRGIANYYGVGAYLRPLSDARASGVLFAAECLAFANVPEPQALSELSAGGDGAGVNTPAWKGGVPRDVGASWDFDDVRDHYLQELYGFDPMALLAEDEERYLELSRALSGEVMAEVFGEWRRGGSRCGGGLVLTLRDLRPGAGWGILDHQGGAKVAYHHLRRSLLPLAVWSTDEGLSGIDVHVANDGAEAVRARLRVALYSNFELPVEQVERDLELAPHSSWSGGIEALIGRFVDVSWSYRFGPPAQDLVALSLEEVGGAGSGGGGELLSQSFRFPVGRPLVREAPERLGLTAMLAPRGERDWDLRIDSRRFAYCVRVNAPGFSASDDAFSVEPGGGRTIRLTGQEDGSAPAGTLSALNLRGHVPIMSLGQR